MITTENSNNRPKIGLENNKTYKRNNYKNTVMTKINRMQMKGFKSFNQRTEILFGNDFNCILGPNGSGKSNVLDSLCFVLGKSSSKSLRADKSANLIYNGGKSKKPASYGEVSIFFDNKNKTFPLETDEVKITRIIKNTGTSVYKINDVKRTRSEMLDLMSHAKINPNGYNIVLQGDVVRFTEMPTDKRRVIIEDISGISLYEEKKLKAVKDLEKVDERLNNANIILNEKKVHLKELKKDRDQALEYKGLSDKIKENNACYIKIRLDKKQGDLDDLSKKKGKKQEVFDKVQAKIDGYRKENTEKKEELNSIIKEIETKGEREQIKISKELENIRVEIATSKERINSCNNEIERIGQRKTQLQESFNEINGKITSSEKERDAFQKQHDRYTKEKAELQNSVKKFKEKNKLDQDMEELTKDIESIDTNSDALQKVIDVLREKQQEFVREKDKLEFMVQSADERINKVHEIEKGHKKELDDLKRKQVEFKETTLNLNKKLTHDGILHSRLLTTKKDILADEEKLSKLVAKSRSIKDVSLASQAIAMILENKDKLTGVHGTILNY